MSVYIYVYTDYSVNPSPSVSTAVSAVLYFYILFSIFIFYGVIFYFIYYIQFLCFKRLHFFISYVLSSPFTCVIFFEHCWREPENFIANDCFYVTVVHMRIKILNLESCASSQSLQCGCRFLLNKEPWTHKQHPCIMLFGIFASEKESSGCTRRSNFTLSRSSRVHYLNWFWDSFLLKLAF